MEELNPEVRQYGVGVSGGVEHVALRTRMHHEAGNCMLEYTQGCHVCSCIVPMSVDLRCSTVT